MALGQIEISHSPSWPRTYYAAKDNCELKTLLTLPPHVDFTGMRVRLASGMEPRATRVVDKCYRLSYISSPHLIFLLLQNGFPLSKDPFLLGSLPRRANTEARP